MATPLRSFSGPHDRRHPLRSTLALAFLAAMTGSGDPARAASTVGDLDLLAAANVPPNVMLVLDNSGSMGDPFDATLETKASAAGTAFTNLVNNILYPTDATNALGYDPLVRLGLAVYDPTGSRSGASIEVPIADNNKTTILSTITTRTTTIGGTGTLLSEALVDVGRYFAGEHGFGTYPAVATTSPIDLECRENFVVFLTDGISKDDQNTHYGASVAGTTAFSTFVDTIGNADGDANECSLAAPATCIDDPRGGRDDGVIYANVNGTDWMDDVAYYLAHTDLVPDATLAGDQIVVTYTIGFAVDHPLLSETALNGTGEYFTVTDSAGLADSLENAFNSIFARTRGAFTSGVVPGAQIGLGNAFYNSYFETNDEPVWEGHLEALRITSSGVIQDGGYIPAVDTTTGQFLDSRTPFWDAAIPLQTHTSRTIYTTQSGAQVSFDNSNVDETDLALTTDYANYPNSGNGIITLAGLRDAVIDYVRGKDAFDEDNDSDTTDMRPIVLGDIFHSTPLILARPTRLLANEDGFLGFLSDYEERDRVVYAGANDGMLHAFDGGVFQNGDDSNTTDVVEITHYTPGFGTELFGYVPEVILDKMKELPKNVDHDEYFVDGPLTAADAWLGDSTGTDTDKSTPEWATVLIASLREGGRGYLALDVTDPDATSGTHYPYPKFLWEFTDSKLGESWSKAVITRVKVQGVSGDGDECGPSDGDGDCREQWVAIFGGGYEPTGDPNRNTYIADPNDAKFARSKSIYMVNLRTGALLARVEFDATDTGNLDGMKYSIASQPAVLDVNFDGFADVVYVGDLGGQVWKWDIHTVGQDTDSDTLLDWPAGVFFRSDPEVFADSSLHYRSFFFAPAASYVKGNLVLAFGSGERHNLGYAGDASEDENNRFFVAKDPDPIGASAFASVTVESDLTDVTGLDTDTSPLDAGYYFTLADGEKFVTEVDVFAGHVIAGSYTPEQGADVCETVAGQSFLYVFKLSNGQGFFPDPMEPPSEDRRLFVGSGLPTNPEVTVATDPDDDVILVKTSDGRLLQIDAPPRDEPRASLIYWQQVD